MATRCLARLFFKSTPAAASAVTPSAAACQLVLPGTGVRHSSSSYDSATADPAPVSHFPVEVAKEELDKFPDAPPTSEIVGEVDARDTMHLQTSSADAERQQAMKDGMASDVVSGEAEARAKVLNADQDTQRQEEWDQASAGEKLAAGAKKVKETVLSGYNKAANQVGDRVTSLNDARDQVTTKDP